MPEEPAGENTHCHHSYSNHAGGTNEGVEKSLDVDGFGNWMTLQRKNFRKLSLNQKNKDQSPGQDKSGGESSSYEHKSKVVGSRFEVLSSEKEEGSPIQKPSSIGSVGVVNFSSGSGQVKRGAEARRRKSNVDCGTKYSFMPASTPEKQVISSSSSLDNSKATLFQSPVREAILINRNGTFSSHGGSSLAHSVRPSVSLPSSLKNKEFGVAPGSLVSFKENPPDTGGGLKVVGEKGRGPMVLDDITNSGVELSKTPLV